MVPIPMYTKALLPWRWCAHLFPRKQGPRTPFLATVPGAAQPLVEREHGLDRSLTPVDEHLSGPKRLRHPRYHALGCLGLEQLRSPPPPGFVVA